MSFYGRDGSYNYYTDADGQLYYDTGSSLEPLGIHESSFNIGYLKDSDGGWYGAVNTSDEGASNMHLPSRDTITSTGTNYDPYGMSEYVDYSSMSHNSTPTSYANNDEFVSGIANDKPQVVVLDNGLKSNSFFLYGSDIKPTSDGKLTLVYDERAGRYYPLNDNGNYDRDMYGWTPEELTSHYSVK